MIFPPALALPAAVAAVGPDGGVDLGVQNLHEAESGAFTGENSAAAAVEVGAVAALVGHSSDEDLVQVTAGSDAAPGNYDITEQRANEIRTELEARRGTSVFHD